MNFICKNEELFKKYDVIFKNISQKIGKELSSEPTFENDQGTHIKTSSKTMNGQEEILITCVHQS